MLLKVCAYPLSSPRLNRKIRQGGRDLDIPTRLTTYLARGLNARTLPTRPEHLKTEDTEIVFYFDILVSTEVMPSHRAEPDGRWPVTVKEGHW
jgi:hypothetical protein